MLRTIFSGALAAVLVFPAAAGAESYLTLVPGMADMQDPPGGGFTYKSSAFIGLEWEKPVSENWSVLLFAATVPGFQPEPATFGTKPPSPLPNPNSKYYDAYNYFDLGKASMKPVLLNLRVGTSREKPFRVFADSGLGATFSSQRFVSRYAVFTTTAITGGNYYGNWVKTYEDNGGDSKAYFTWDLGLGVSYALTGNLLAGLEGRLFSSQTEGDPTNAFSYSLRLAYRFGGQRELSLPAAGRYQRTAGTGNSASSRVPQTGEEEAAGPDPLEDGAEQEEEETDEYETRAALGDGYFSRKEYKSALAEYGAALSALAPDDGRRVYGLERQAAACLKLNDLNKAREFYLAAIMTAKKMNLGGKDLVNSYLGLAYCFGRSGKTGLAAKNYRKALSLSESEAVRNKIRTILEKLESADDGEE